MDLHADHRTDAMPPIPGVPSGLEYLTVVDQLLVHQKVEILEVLTGFETCNQYEIKNSLGQTIYTATEETDCLTRNSCGKLRAFKMKVKDNFGGLVMEFYRPLACDNCCFPCCLQSIEVKSSAGEHLGSVSQSWTLCKPKFWVNTSDGNPILCIDGPCVLCGFMQDVNFDISTQYTQVGRISKQWSGFIKEMFTDADNFGVSFPMDLDVRVKATILAATLLIDFMYYEETGKSSAFKHN